MAPFDHRLQPAVEHPEFPPGAILPQGKLLHHSKAIRGSKADAQRYVNWVGAAFLLSSGQAFAATVSQSQLRELQALQAKVDRFREKLEGAIRTGATVEPGPRHLSAQAGSRDPMNR